MCYNGRENIRDVIWGPIIGNDCTVELHLFQRHEGQTVHLSGVYVIRD